MTEQDSELDLEVEDSGVPSQRKGNWLSYVPSAVFAVIEIAVVLAVLDNSQYSNNSDVMAGLVLLYATVRSFAMSLGINLVKLGLVLNSEIVKIKERIKDDYDVKEEREDLDVLVRDMRKAEIKVVIRAVGVGIIYLIALASLLN